MLHPTLLRYCHQVKLNFLLVQVGGGLANLTNLRDITVADKSTTDTA